MFPARSDGVERVATSTPRLVSMRLVMTLMVRDEADVIAAMIEHHLAQGIDLIIATDNGSVDGTREILQRYEDLGVLELHDDLRHDKQQSQVVTRMARRAAEKHAATWVINADADEFFVPVDRSLTLRGVFEKLPVEIGAFEAPVVNLTGTPAHRGSGIRRLVWRDDRPNEDLMQRAGLYAQPTANAIHIAHPQVEVAQGNHFVTLPDGVGHTGVVPSGLEIEVLHLPWRSLLQHAAKIEATGRAYDGNPRLHPSPNHHGMRDYRRHVAGMTETFYLYRHPAAPESDPEFTHDDTVLQGLTALAAQGARVPDLLRDVLDDSDDGPFDAAAITASAPAVRAVLPIERAYQRPAEDARQARWRAGDELTAARKEIDRLNGDLAAERARSAQLHRALKNLQNTSVVRVARGVKRRAASAKARLRR